jgi:large subunit ribosomal protein L21
MEAIIRDGGRQFMVKEGLTIQVDFREADAGSAVEFGEVLYVHDDSGARVGRPLVEGARVVGKVLGQEKGKKVMVTHFRRRKDSRRRNGHRQPYTSVQIQKIQG